MIRLLFALLFAAGCASTSPSVTDPVSPAQPPVAATQPVNHAAPQPADAPSAHDTASGGVKERKMCGGIAAFKCQNPGEYCAYDPGICGRGDQSGTCAPRPTVCPRLLKPVCGCDGKTYSNDCNAAVAGVSLDHPGPCG